MICSMVARNYKWAVFATVFLVLMACGDKPQDPETKSKSKATTQKKDTAITNSSVKNIIFYGNSLTAGYGVDPSEAFPALVQEKIDSAHLDYKVINAGLSGETTAGGKGRIDWILQQPVDVFVLELGGNDGLRGIPVKETTKNLQFIIDHVKQKYPSAKIILAGMQIPPNMGARYANEFRSAFKELADRNQLLFIPFLLEGVGGIPELNQADGIHPTAKGHKIVANNVWAVIKDVVVTDAVKP
jgi:acyl-CoA thioesterase I